MREVGSNYVRVEANEVMPRENGNSGGYQVGGYYVNWTTEGITGQEWTAAIKLPYSPFGNMTVEEIKQTITDDGNLNSVFAEWAKTYPSAGDQLDFLVSAENIYGSTPEGCIGAQMYI